MAWSEVQVLCFKHPNETPQPGVCPSCLRERLSRIVGRYETASFYKIYASSPSPAYDSASSSGRSSPPRHRLRRHQRVASDVMDSIYLALGRGGSRLKKSRSMANYATRDDEGVNKKKNKGGFWNKLLLRSTVNKF